jgi:uncharacterized damage-inducible protein DinB
MAEFIRYNNWANQLVLTACQALSDEQLNASIPGAYGTVRGTLEHIFRAEAGYVRSLTGDRPEPAFDWEDKPSLPELQIFAAQVGNALLETVERIPATKLIIGNWQGQEFRYTAMILYIQIVNHGIEHRTNITTLLNQWGQNPPDVAGWGYLIANQTRFDPEAN